MDNKKNPKIDAARRRKTGVPRCFKKHSFKGNRYTKNNDLTNISSNTTEDQVSSAMKLIKGSLHIEKREQLPYLLIDLDIFSQIINVTGLCPSCESKNISFITNPVKKKGLSSCLEFSCQNCSEWTKEIYTSKELNDIRKIVWIFRSSSPSAFNETQKTVFEADNTVALQSMTDDAADELQGNKDEQGISDGTGYCDGSWQKWGHSSLNGTVTKISSDSGKYLDYRVIVKT